MNTDIVLKTSKHGKNIIIGGLKYNQVFKCNFHFSIHLTIALQHLLLF